VVKNIIDQVQQENEQPVLQLKD